MRKKFFGWVGVFALMAGSLIVPLALGGCGGDSSTTNGSSASTASVTSPPAETPLPAPKPEPGQPVAVEQTSPYGAGSVNDQAVGMLIDGLQLMDVRSADHDSYFRVVYDFATAEGEPVLQVPHAETSLTPDGKTLRVTISGVRSLGNSPNAKATEIPVNNNIVTTINKVPSMDDQALIYEIHLTQGTTYALAGLGSPGRIVIDVMKP